MHTTVIASPLENEYWALEGIFFEGSGPASIVCKICGNPVYKGYVELRFLDGFDVTISKVNCAETLSTVIVQGDMAEVNNSFIGTGLVFKKDFDKKEDLTVCIEGDGHRHTFSVVLQ